jgi:hypothetical protein
MSDPKYRREYGVGVPGDLDDAVVYLLQLAVEFHREGDVKDGDPREYMPHNLSLEGALSRVIRALLHHRDERFAYSEIVRAIFMVKNVVKWTDELEQATGKRLEDNDQTDLVKRIDEYCRIERLTSFEGKAQEMLEVAAKKRGDSREDALERFVNDTLGPGSGEKSLRNHKEALKNCGKGAVKTVEQFTAIHHDMPPPKYAVREYVDGLLAKTDGLKHGTRKE